MAVAALAAPTRSQSRWSAIHSLFAVGLLLELLIGMVPAAMIGAAEAQCSRISASGISEWSCVESPPTWVEYARGRPGGIIFERTSANLAFAVSVALAALLIPAAFGLAIRRWLWPMLAGGTATISVVAGYVAGRLAAERVWPDVPADQGWAFWALIFGPIIGMVLALPFASVSAATSVAVARQRRLDAPPWAVALLALLFIAGLILCRLVEGMGFGLYP